MSSSNEHWVGQRRPRRLGQVRALALVLHRWVGLFIASFLIVAGATGTVIAFFAELDLLVNPELHRVRAPAADRRLLDPLELRERVQSAFPDQPIRRLLLKVEPERSVNYWVGDREYFIDPYTGKILDSRGFGDISEGKKNLLTFLYKLHYSLQLGKTGEVILGLVAVLWVLDCFVGAYLTFPAASRSGGARSGPAWLSRWARAWLLKTKQLLSLVFSWHRASGLWLWGLLLVFAWSGVALNLNQQVYRPVMDAVLPKHASPPRRLDAPRPAAKLSWNEALERGRRLMAGAAAQRGFQVIRERWLTYEPEFGSYTYTVESSRDLAERLPRTKVRFDGDDGHLLAFDAAIGEDTRSAVDIWLIALHFGTIRELGLTYRVFVSLFGLLVTALSVTGVWIWWRKRARRPSAIPRGAPALARWRWPLTR